MSKVTKFNVGNVICDVRDANTLRNLTDEKEMELIDSGTYNGEEVIGEEIFTTDHGEFKKYINTLVQPGLSSFNDDSVFPEPDNYYCSGGFTANDSAILAIGQINDYDEDYPFYEKAYISHDLGNSWTDISLSNYSPSVHAAVGVKPVLYTTRCYILDSYTGINRLTMTATTPKWRQATATKINGLHFTDFGKICDVLLYAIDTNTDKVAMTTLYNNIDLNDNTNWYIIENSGFISLSGRNVNGNYLYAALKNDGTIYSATSNPRVLSSWSPVSMTNPPVGDITNSKIYYNEYDYKFYIPSIVTDAETGDYYSILNVSDDLVDWYQSDINFPNVKITDVIFTYKPTGDELEGNFVIVKTEGNLFYLSGNNCSVDNLTFNPVPAYYESDLIAVPTVVNNTNTDGLMYICNGYCWYGNTNPYYESGLETVGGGSSVLSGDVVPDSSVDGSKGQIYVLNGTSAYICVDELNTWKKITSPSSTTLTLSSSSWDSEDKEYVIPVVGLTSSTVVWLAPSVSADNSNEEAYATYGVRVKEQNNGSITLGCTAVPPQNISIELIM